MKYTISCSYCGSKDSITKTTVFNNKIVFTCSCAQSEGKEQTIWK